MGKWALLKSKALVPGAGHGLWSLTFVVQDFVILEVHPGGLGVLFVTVYQQDGAVATRAPGPGALGTSGGQKTLSDSHQPLGVKWLVFSCLPLV